MATYTVKSGDILSRIAIQYGVKVSDISGYKSGNPNLIYPGEILTIGGTPSVTPIIPTPPEVPKDVITSENLISPTETPFLSPVNQPVYDVSGLNADYTLTPKQIEAQSLTEQLQSINESLVRKGEFTAQQNEALGVNAAQQTMDDLNSQLVQLKNQASAIPIALEQGAKGRGITGEILNRQTNEQLRLNSIQALTISSLMDAANLRLSSAQKKVDAAVAQKYGTLEAEYEAKSKNLQLIQSSPQYTQQEKQQAAQVQARLDAQKAQQDQQKADQQQIWALAVQAASNLASFTPTAQYRTAAVALQAMQDAPDKETALAIASATGLTGTIIKPSYQYFTDEMGNVTQYNEVTGEIKTIGQVAKGITGVTEKPPTAAESTVAGYASRLEQAEPTLISTEANIVSMNPIAFNLTWDKPAWMQSTELQQYMQAARNFINAILRRESGAVISPTEFQEARQQYLPQPGDSQETLTLKRNNRKLVFENLKKAAGNAYTSLEKLLGETDNQNKEVNIGGELDLSQFEIGGSAVSTIPNL